MIKNDFIKITNLIKKELLENKVLKEAAIEEEKEGNLIDITSIIKQIKILILTQKSCFYT